MKLRIKATFTKEVTSEEGESFETAKDNWIKTVEEDPYLFIDDDRIESVVDVEEVK